MFKVGDKVRIVDLGPSISVITKEEPRSNVMFKVGDKVRIVNIGSNRVDHPTEWRNIKNGDEVVITIIGEAPNGTQIVSWGCGAVFTNQCEMVLVKDNECVCPSNVLLWGHLPGCKFKNYS